jgi:hypothetical protein
MDIRHAPKLAWKNKNKVQASQTVECYLCLNIYPSKDIKDWTDNGTTAICPHCQCDTVLAEGLNQEQLKQIRDFWFPKLNCC